MKTLRHAVAPVLIALAGAVLASALVVFSAARRVVTPVKRPPDTDILAIDNGAQTIDLRRTPDTELPGRYGLYTTGTYRYLKLGTILSTTDRFVRRKLLTEVEPGAVIDSGALFSGWYYASPSELHIPWSNALIGSPAGPCPAWYFPAASDTWVIQIHGRGTTRAECLRAVPVFHAEGIASLFVSYRNDGEAPRSRGGAYSLGIAEWRDIDAAIGYALRNGAKQVLLMGWSMGGAIALQTLVSSGNRAAIAGVILDSPVVDWRSVLRFQAKEAGLIDPIPSLAMGALESSLTSRFAGADQPIRFGSLDMVARSSELSVPILILHSDDDGFVPSDASHALANARPDIVTMRTFAVARHTKIWNYDEDAWVSAIAEWLDAEGFSVSRVPGA